MTPQDLEEQYGPGGHPEWTIVDWRYDVANGDTKLGYWEWVAHNIESHPEETEYLDRAS